MLSACTVPVVGHINPGLPIARALVGRGHEVCWYTGRKYQAQVEATGARYQPMRAALDEHFPDDLREAIEASPRARKTFRSLGRQNRYALAFRTTNMKTPAGRARKIAALVEMLERGETPHPERR